MCSTYQQIYFETETRLVGLLIVSTSGQIRSHEALITARYYFKICKTSVTDTSKQQLKTKSYHSLSIGVVQL